MKKSTANLCCQLHPAWSCDECGWCVCRLHWKGNALEMHDKRKATKCPVKATSWLFSDKKDVFKYHGEYAL